MVSRSEIIELLKNVNDPELMMSVVDLGLVYRVDVSESKIEVDFTLTYPGCPAADYIQDQIVQTIRDYTGVDNVVAQTVWDPPWRPDYMSEEARVSLGYPI